jgi:hypothetical protein
MLPSIVLASDGVELFEDIETTLPIPTGATERPKQLHIRASDPKQHEGRPLIFSDKFDVPDQLLELGTYKGNDFEVQLQTKTGKALLYYSFRKETGIGTPDYTLHRYRLITTGRGKRVEKGEYEFWMDEAEIWEVHHNRRGKEKYRSVWVFDPDELHPFIEFSLTC